MQTGREEALADDYYLANFHRLAGFVCSTYSDILSPEERQWYKALQAASEPAQRLYIRLLTRKGSVFRLDRLRYPEICDLNSAAAELAARGLADVSPPADLAELVATYTKPELLRLLKDTGSGTRTLKSSLSRVELVQQLLGRDEPIRQQYTRILQQADRWISLWGYPYWTVFRLGFFGNLYQDSSEFVLTDLGTVHYENYTLDKNARAFGNRSQLDRHLRYFECEALIDTIDMKNVGQLIELVECLPETLEHDEHLRRRVDRFRNRVARQLERLQEVPSALALYEQSMHPPARERRVRLHLQLGECDRADRLLQVMESQPFNDAECQVAERLRRQVDKVRGVKSTRYRHFRPQSSRLVLRASGSRVELAAQQFYARFGSCFFTENTLVNAVLGLFIWDIIFHPVPGVFYNPFQAAPADFHQPSFSERRRDLLAGRLTELHDPLRFSARVMNNFSEHRGKANPLVRWGRMTNELMALAIGQIPAAHWEVMFQRILRDTRENTSGFPDLVLFREMGEYELIEIKGPGDTLQQNQLRWMRCFNDHGIPCRVVNVRWSHDSGPDCAS